MNLDFHFVLAMNAIVCTASVENVLRTSVCTSPTVFGGGSVKVWDGICHDGRTHLTIVQGTLNAVKYRDDILDPIVLPFLQQRNFDHVFQHGNARCHVTSVCQDFLSQNHIRILPWSALAPDLSLIEHLWDDLGRHVGYRQNPPETLLVHEWNNIPQAFTND